MPPTLPATREDLDAVARIGRRFLRLQRSHPRWLRAMRQADRRLAAEWCALIGLTYLIIYGPLPWQLKLVILVPWGIYASFSADVIVHYSNHWPPFRNGIVHGVWRSLGVLIFWAPLEIRYHHWQHHQAYDLEDDLQHRLRQLARRSFVPRVCGLAWYLAVESFRLQWSFMPWAPLPDYIRRLRRSRPAHYWEIVLVRWACAAWLLALLVVAPLETALLMLPLLLVISPFASVLMNLTDHTPGDLTHPFRQATYHEPTTLWERLGSALNHQTAAPHLTHHLCPQVHFAFVVRLQRRLLRYYRRHGAPESLMCGTALVGNPWAVAAVLHAVVARVGSEPPGGQQNPTTGQSTAT